MKALYIIVATLALFATNSKGQESFVEKYTFSQLNMDKGLQHNYIDDIIKDTRGFVWVATNGGGLSRFDGYTFVNYDVSTPATIKSNFVHGLCTDHFDRLWIASDGGIDVLRLRDNKLVTSALTPAADSALFDDIVIAIKTDANGNIWLTSQNTLACIRLTADGQIDRVIRYDSDQRFTAVESIDGKIWVAQHSQLYLPHIAGDNISLEQYNVPSIPEANAMISTIYARDNELWVGTDGGIFRINMVSGQQKRYMSVDGDRHSLSQNRITDIEETPQHEIAIATLKGLNIYNQLTDQFEQVLQDNDGPHVSISSNFINCLFRDGNTLWIGTEIGGIDVAEPNDLQVHNYVNTSSDKSLSANPVNSIIEDAEGNLWVGNVESGLNLRRKDRDTFEHFTTKSHGLTHNSISALAIDTQNRLWVGTWGGGVNIIDLSRQTFAVTERLTNFASPYIGTLTCDTINNGMWVTTVNEVYFVRGGQVYTPIDRDITEHMQGTLGSLIDRNGRLWIGTSGIMLRIDLKTLAGNKVDYEVFGHKLDAPNSKLLPHVSFFCEAQDGTIYVGTNGFGIYSYHDNMPQPFVNYTARDGLINNSVRGIAEDNNGNIWISTNGGLSVFEPQSKRFTSYTTDKGMLCDTYYWNSAYASKTTGNIYFGSTQGLTEIRHRIGTQTTTETTEPQSPVFTQIWIDNQTISAGSEYLDADISYCNTIEMHERDKWFSIEFASLNYQDAEHTHYQYRLRGFDTNWIDALPDHRVATYTNLRQGDYVLQVRCTTDMERWSEPAELAITIKPFFYKTVWFYCLTVILITLIIWRIYKHRTHSLREQRKQLHSQVLQRTKQLREQTQALELKTRELKQQNIVLSEQNKQITEQKESILEMSKKIQKLTMDKMQFFTNISHEFRSPITLIIGPIQRAMKMTNDPQVREQLQLVERSSNQLMRLVNQLMDFRKVESGDIELHPKAGKLLPLAADIAHPFAVFASERGITLSTYFRLEAPLVMFDADAINKILTNLLSNAVKFTPDGGRVQLFIAAIHRDGKPFIYISVRDNGRGIPAKDLDRIFERFYQSDNQQQYQPYGQSGTGIGLYLVRQLANQSGGEVYARNNKGGGCSMRLFMPLAEASEDSLPVDDITTEEPEVQPEATEQKLNVLVVEDNADMRTYVRSILSEQYNVLEAKDGMVGLATLAENEVDFIICDIMMPVMDGIEFSQKVKSNFAFSHIPILILTAQLSDEYRTQSYRIGVESYLHKPFDEQMLLARISGILESRKSSQKKFQYTLNTDDLDIDRESDDNKFVRRVLDHVREHYTNPDYAIDDILHDLACSKSMLNKKMQNVIGLSPGVFIRSYRLNVAKQLIIHNKETKAMNISQIAYEVGFNDPKYFTRCFTKHFNVTPSSLLESGRDEKTAAPEAPDFDKLIGGEWGKE